MRVFGTPLARWLAVTAATSLVLTAAPAVALTSATSPASSPTVDDVALDDTGARIDPRVEADLESAGTADFWVRFEARPDLSVYSGIADWDVRGQAVYDALTRTAESSQASARALLDEDGTTYQAFWGTNAIRVWGGTAEQVEALAASSEVEAIYGTFEIIPPETEDDEPAYSPSAVEWGIADINADDVWSTYEATGTGIVVASIDTGVQWDHPALINQYRGYDADSGTADHNYNWYNAGHGNPAFPNDPNGHGTHVTGTMVGDDLAGNQIGVAPGATWISANGCCPSDAALIGSGEWTLAPTDLTGNNPRPDLRPHIINNSWGSTSPSNDPFMEDISEAWAAAGQFGVWANGNSGPNCNTSGSPGSRIINYSVGNYTANHTIANLSSRGAGQDGVIKPNISAPGTGIRSAWPGSGYNSISGTSMASPHVAGAIALLWEASPALYGNIEDTWALLNGTAIDTENLQCGGTAENNNVFGEGRLDAFALVSSSPLQDSAHLVGVVTEADSGDPISGATVQTTGPTERTIITGIDGTYAVYLEAGSYTLTVSAFGFDTTTRAVTLAEQQEATEDFALERSPSAVVSGTVTDGSGAGWPLAATVAVPGTSLSTTTDPATGTYSFEVPLGEHVLEATADLPGYHPASQSVTVTTAGATAGFALPVDILSCVAPGYVQSVDIGDPETFDATTAPPGWTVTDDEGNGQTWVFNNPGGRINLTGGSGNFAIIDSDDFGIGQVQRTGLVAPPQNFAADVLPVVEFKQDFRVWDAPIADVDYSIDGGTTWITALSQTGEARGPDTVRVPLNEAAGETDVLIRFYLTDDGWSWWWQVDDVAFGTVACTVDDLPKIQVDPTELTSTQLTDTVTEHDLTISNIGTADLVFDITEADELGTDGVGSTDSADPVALPVGADRAGTTPSASTSAPARVEPAAVPLVDTLEEGFEDVTGLPGQGWAIVNNSSPIGSNSWFQGNPDVFPSHVGEPADYAAVNWASGGGTIAYLSNWLLTPEVTVADGAELTFWTRGPVGSAFADRLEVRLSTSGASTDVGTTTTSVGDFDTLLLTINEDLDPPAYPQAWTEYTVTISGVAEPTTGRLAFRYHVPDGGPSGVNSNFIGIDTLSYTSPSEPPEPHACDAGTDVPWLSASPAGGTITAGSSTVVTVSLDSTGLAVGDYTANLCINSNDADAPRTLVPVTLTISDEPPPTITTTRIYGDDRYETAAALAEGFEPGIEVVYVATGTAFADALSGSALAGHQGAPVLLTKSTALPSVTAAKLAELAPQRVVVLGGAPAVADTVLTAIGNAAGTTDVTRLEGSNRYATAAAVAAEFTDPDVVYIATGQNYPDALAGSARAGWEGHPILLVQTNHLPAVTRQALVDLGPSEIRVLGSNEAVSDAVALLLEDYAPVVRIEGTNRIRTAVAISQVHDSVDTVYLASATNFPDALVAGAVAAAAGKPLLLTWPDSLPHATGVEILRLGATDVIVLGGPEAIALSVDDQIEALTSP